MITITLGLRKRALKVEIEWFVAGVTFVFVDNELNKPVFSVTWDWHEFRELGNKSDQHYLDFMDKLEANAKLQVIKESVASALVVPGGDKSLSNGDLA